MGKNTELLNIYLKIHQKRKLSWEDLEYLARFDPECFEKTCKNVVYNMPQAKPVIFQEQKTEEKMKVQKEDDTQEEKRFFVGQLLENLKNMDPSQLPMVDFDLERVKNLLGNLYMELLFPHNDDKESFFSPMGEEKGSIFDKKA